MRYMLLICGEESAVPSSEQLTDMEKAGMAWAEEMDARGVRLQGSRLRPATDATTVRVRDEQTLLSDGPFAETREQVGGFDLIECRDLDEAIEVASKHPVAKYGSVEVRPLWEG
jgi:hypothetical protein